MSAEPIAVLAVDGGNSKADLGLVARDGTLLATVRGPTISHQRIGVAQGIDRLRRLVSEAARKAGIEMPTGHPLAEVGLYCVAGADFRREFNLLQAAFSGTGLSSSTTVLNDTLAALRAGTDRSWGVVLICGAGVNATGIGPAGRVARLAALGNISGDAGGGRDLGMAALAAAVRARDGRGPRTVLERLVPEHFGLPRPESVTRAIYDGRIDEDRLLELAPIVFTAAGMGDGVARSILDRLADELATMAIAMIRRVRIARLKFDVVLAGGVFANRDDAFYARLADGVLRVAPGARMRRLRVRPLLGAALLGIERLTPPAAPGAASRLRKAFAQLAG